MRQKQAQESCCVDRSPARRRERPSATPALTRSMRSNSTANKSPTHRSGLARISPHACVAVSAGPAPLRMMSSGLLGKGRSGIPARRNFTIAFRSANIPPPLDGAMIFSRSCHVMLLMSSRSPLPAGVLGVGWRGHRIIALLADRALANSGSACSKRSWRRFSQPTNPTLGQRPTSPDEAIWADALREKSPEGRVATSKWHYVKLDPDNPDLKQACFGRPAPAGDDAGEPRAARDLHRRQDRTSLQESCASPGLLNRAADGGAISAESGRRHP